MRKPYLISDIGINHNADLQIVKQLIDATFACGWNCVKFQKRNPHVCVPESLKDVMKSTPWGDMTYLEYKLKMEFSKDDYDYIDRYCKEKPIAWSASVWDLDSLEFLIQYDVPFIKIPSAKLTDWELLHEAVKTDLPIILSTGMSTIEEVDQAVEILKKRGHFSLMHCNSSYPAPMEDLNLLVIPFFKSRYNCMIGYSGHEYGVEPSVIAVSLGAVLLERHITLDHNMWGTDQKSSLEISAMDILRRRVDSIPLVLGNGIKIITEGEKEILKKLRG
jgi:N-acetylneuraminate synthase